MELIMDIVGEVLEGLFKFLAKSSFGALSKKIKGEEESDDRIADETWDEEENEGSQWEEVNYENELNYEDEEDYANEANDESKVENSSESNYSNKFRNLGAKSNLFNVYNTIKSKVNGIEDCNNIEYKTNKNTASTDIQENNKSDLLFNGPKDSGDNIKQSGSNHNSYDIQQNNQNQSNLSCDVQQNNNQINSELEFNKCALRNAIIYSEILGKPKAKSRRRCRNWR